MTNNFTLDETLLGDLILCEPITTKGRASLSRLGLSANEISSSYFYKKLRVASKYNENSNYIYRGKDASVDDKLYYQYTVGAIQYEELKRRLHMFNLRFDSNAPYEYPLLLLGVAGNGKSIEINRRIQSIVEEYTECCKVYIDFENAFDAITYGTEYKCPQRTPLWLFCIKILESIMNYIRQPYLSYETIYNNFNAILVQENLVDNGYVNLFEHIGGYQRGDNTKEKALFDSIISLLSNKDAEANIQILIKILMLIMYCSSPDRKHYIVFDNIEQYIKLNAKKIQIPNSDISHIYVSINNVVNNIIYSFDRIEQDLGWRTFKIIIALRRTSIGFLDPSLLHSMAVVEKNTMDITGYIQISDIWHVKKLYLWEPFLQEKYNNKVSKDLIQLADFVMNDGEQAIGTDYQSIISPLMSYGIRRNGRSQAHSIYCTFELLKDSMVETINQEQFYIIFNTQPNHAARYMFRRALLELQFKWAISTENQDRWKKLNVGHLDGSSRLGNISVEKVHFNDPDNVTYARRILSYLSHFPEKNEGYSSNHGRTIAHVYSTMSLYSLIKGVMINPQTSNKKITTADFEKFATVLLALGNMSNQDTRSAPYIILNINDKTFHSFPEETILAKLLNDIWQAGEENSLFGQKYNCGEFGARITDAGCVFLFDWQASFSFMAALHCFAIPPLFFLKDIYSIQYVIKTVYEASEKICKMYENEASRFCGNNTLKISTYIPKHNEQYITFRRRVKDLHINHLNLYRDYINRNYGLLSLSEDDASIVVASISKYIYKYNNWDTSERGSECF